MREMSCCYVVVFFFQAEDGIRDIGVTGVQTCALPISPRIQVRRMPFFRRTVVMVPVVVARRASAMERSRGMATRVAGSSGAGNLEPFLPGGEPGSPTKMPAGGSAGRTRGIDGSGSERAGFAREQAEVERAPAALLHLADRGGRLARLADSACGLVAAPHAVGGPFRLG